MARTRTERSRSKPSPIDELTQNIEQLQAILPKVEDLGRDGLPYLEGAKTRTELQLRECIKRAFGDKSPEYQANRQLKLAIGPTSEHAQSVSTLKRLITNLEDKKLELQGLKPPVTEEPPTSTAQVSSPDPRPELTLVPPTTQPDTTTEPPPAALAAVPDAMPTQPATATETSPATPSPSAVSMPAAPPPVQQVEAPQVAVLKPKPESIAPEQVSELFRPHETGSVAPLVMPPPKPAMATVAASPPQPSHPAPTPPVVETPNPSTTQEVPVQPPTMSVQHASAHSPAQPIASQPTYSTTQEIPVPPQPIQQNSVLPAPTATPHESTPQAIDHLELCRRLGQRFHPIARQLRLRGEYRPTVAIEDEIDAQDLLHAMLRVQFDDIGTDEWTPGYSPDNPRTTYFLDHDKLAIIVKKTRAGLSAKDLAEQLRLDIERYRTRERCTALFCFVYDPEGRIGNPRGLENDLATTSDHFTVDVLVAPK